MKLEPILIEKYSMAIIADEHNQKLIAYDLQQNGEINPESEGILEEISQDIADELVSCNVGLQDYDINIVENAV